MKRYTSKMQHVALEAMIKAAHERQVFKGVAVILVLRSNYSQNTRLVLSPVAMVNYKMYRDADPHVLSDDIGSNYYGIAMGKIAVMLADNVNSGVKNVLTVRKGESPYRGGLVVYSNGCWVFVAYSGGRQDEDVEIAKAGLESLGIDLSH